LQKQQILLLTLCRGIFQMSRNCFGPLFVSMATEYSYSPAEKGMLLSAFAAGYALTQVPGGLAADYWGSKPLLVLGLLTSAGSMFLVPVAADAGVVYLWWLLFLMGFTQGPTYPAQQVAVSKWANTPTLKSLNANIAPAGSTLGSLLALGFTPFLEGRLGWRSTAWFFGTVTTFVGVLEVCIGGSAPGWAQKHNGCDGEVKKAPSSGWEKCQKRFSVLFALPVLATFAAHSTANFVRYFLTAWMPTYYREVLEVSADASGVYMTIPDLCGLISCMTIAKLGLGTQLPALKQRRLFSSISFLGAFVGLILVSMVSSPSLVTLFLCLVQGLATLQGSGFSQSYTEVSRNYVGLVVGVGNSVATGASMAAPIFASALIPKDSPTGPEAWQILFLCFASANLFGLIMYCSFCSVNPVDVDKEADNSTSLAYSQ
jgi:ACS family glucarate transporter-like MFS transporter